MTKRRAVQALCAFGFFLGVWGGLAGEAGAVAIVESEANNSFATAQNLDGSFSTDLVPDIFNSTTVPHVSVSGTNAATTDVDYYRFTVPAAGVTGYFDIDYGMPGLATTLSLFDAAQNLLANVDYSSPTDPGSVDEHDAFLGVYTFSTPGTYYIAVSNWENLPLAYGTYVEELTRPDGGFGGGRFAGDSGPTTVKTAFGGYSSGDYTLHGSLSAVSVPEPGTLLLLGAGLAGLAALAGLGRRIR